VIDCPVYRAERDCWPLCAAFTEVIADPQAWVTHVTTTEPFLQLRRMAQLPADHVTVTHGARQQTHCSLARVEQQHIDLRHGCAATQGLLLHEVTHLCCPVDEHHGHAYAAAYVRLCRHWLGERAATLLLQALRNRRAFP
jgi:hypothetical protein